MLGCFRAANRTVAAVVLVLLSVATVANHGVGSHDDHGTAFVVHDASAHAFTDGSAPPGGEALHCVLCHLTRTVRPAVEVAHHAPAHAGLTLSVRWPGLVVPSVFPAAEPPLRSPPVSL
jgi:hypothetical protein